MICTSALFKVFVVSNSSTNRQSNQRMNRFLKIVSCRHTSVEYFEHNPRTRNRLGTGNDFPFASSHENDDPRATFARDTFFFFCVSFSEQTKSSPLPVFGQLSDADRCCFRDQIDFFFSCHGLCPEKRCSGGFITWTLFSKSPNRSR